MTKNIEPMLKSISGYLKLSKNECFFIPEYQRSYSWTTLQCEKLWQDIESFIQSINSSDIIEPYFFGTIIVDCSNNGKYSLIDGQQRTTTFLLLLKALLLRINIAIKQMPNDEEAEPLKEALIDNRKTIMSILYKAEPEDIPSMLKDSTKLKDILLLENKSINEQYPKELKTIIESVDLETAEQLVARILNKQKDNKYSNYFRNFKWFYIKLEEVCKTETKLKVFAKNLLHNCQVIEIRSWQTEQAITMFNSLNSTGMPLADADIISAQLYSKAGDDKDKFNEQWKEINKLASELSNQRIIDIDGVLQQFMYISRSIKCDNDVTTPGIRRYYTEEEKGLLDNPLDLCTDFSKIVSKWDKIKDYPIVKLLLKCNENAKLFLSGYLYRFEVEDLNEEKILSICECLLKLFTILELSDTGYSSSKFKTFLFNENIKLVNKTYSSEEIEKDFKEHIASNWTEEVLKAEIDDYEKNFLVFINEYIYAKNRNLIFDFNLNVNIEHIMPASGKNIVIIQKDAGISDVKEFENIVNKLGNKILLEEDINKSLGNEWFKTKKQNTIKSKSGYQNSSYFIARSMVTYPKDTWGKEDIKEATVKATNRIIKFIFQ